MPGKLHGYETYCLLVHFHDPLTDLTGIIESGPCQCQIIFLCKISNARGLKSQEGLPSLDDTVQDASAER